MRTEGREVDVNVDADVDVVHVNIGVGVDAGLEVLTGGDAGSTCCDANKGRATNCAGICVTG